MMTSDIEHTDQQHATTLPNLTLQQLAYLREIGRSNTVTAAANQLGVSQPALSQALAEIERRLDVALFERRSRRLEFTEAGRRTAAFAKVDYVQDCVINHKEVAEMVGNWLLTATAPNAGNLIGWWKCDTGSGG